MNCDDLLAALNDYVDGTLDPSLCEKYRSHLEGCNPCQIVVDNIRQTISLYRAGEPYELPVELHEQLHNLLRTRWKAKFPSAQV
jgi:anti-sigma factor RsiW